MARAQRPAADKQPAPGARPAQSIDRIVTLFVAARADETFNGASLVVAAEKAGLTFGDMKGRGEMEAQPTSEQVAFASLMRGVHW